MKPGATTRSLASMIFLEGEETTPTSTILPPAMPTSARRAGAPVPSMTLPFLIRRSQGMGAIMPSNFGEAYESRDSRRHSHPLRARQRRLQRGDQPGHADRGAQRPRREIWAEGRARGRGGGGRGDQALARLEPGARVDARLGPAPDDAGL